MTIETPLALDALDEAIKWKLRPALDADKLFDDIASRLHRILPNLTIQELDLQLADLRRQHVHDMHMAEWALYDAYRDMIGARNEAA